MQVLVSATQTDKWFSSWRGDIHYQPVMTVKMLNCLNGCFGKEGIA